MFAFSFRPELSLSVGIHAIPHPDKVTPDQSLCFSSLDVMNLDLLREYLCN